MPVTRNLRVYGIISEIEDLSCVDEAYTEDEFLHISYSGPATYDLHVQAMKILIDKGYTPITHEFVSRNEYRYIVEDWHALDIGEDRKDNAESKLNSVLEKVEDHEPK